MLPSVLPLRTQKILVISVPRRGEEVKHSAVFRTAWRACNGYYLCCERQKKENSTPASSL